MFDDIDDEEDMMDTAAAVFATGDVTKADAVPTSATRRPSSWPKHQQQRHDSHQVDHVLPHLIYDERG